MNFPPKLPNLMEACVYVLKKKFEISILFVYSPVKKNMNNISSLFVMIL